MKDKKDWKVIWRIGGKDRLKTIIVICFSFLRKAAIVITTTLQIRRKIMIIRRKGGNRKTKYNLT